MGCATLSRLRDPKGPASVSPVRLPELRSVVVLDDRPPGMFSLEEVMQAGSSRHLQQLRDLQRNLSCDDPVKILFTSVTVGPSRSVLGPALPSLSPTVLPRAPLASQRLSPCPILMPLTIPICLAEEVNTTGG